MINARSAFLKPGKDVDETILQGRFPQDAQRGTILSGASVVAGESGRRSAKVGFGSPVALIPFLSTASAGA
jgi:hypothetical protein